VGEAERLNQVTEGIIGAAIGVHRALGPGLLESAYEAAGVHSFHPPPTPPVEGGEQEPPLPNLFAEEAGEVGVRGRSIVIETATHQLLARLGACGLWFAASIDRAETWASAFLFLSLSLRSLR
jgi:hypothetical protein